MGALGGKVSRGYISGQRTPGCFKLRFLTLPSSLLLLLLLLISSVAELRDCKHSSEILTRRTRKKRKDKNQRDPDPDEPHIIVEKCRTTNGRQVLVLGLGIENFK